MDFSAYWFWELIMLLIKVLGCVGVLGIVLTKD